MNRESLPFFGRPYDRSDDLINMISRVTAIIVKAGSCTSVADTTPRELTLLVNVYH